MEDTKRLSLVIQVDYNLNGVDPKILEDLLLNAARNMAGNGMLSGYTDAEVDEWSARVIPDGNLELSPSATDGLPSGRPGM